MRQGQFRLIVTLELGYGRLHDTLVVVVRVSRLKAKQGA